MLTKTAISLQTVKHRKQNILRTILLKQKEIKGYELKETPVNAAGKIDADETVVTFVYALKDSSVIINYVDENGKEIAASESTTGKYFEKYTTYPKDCFRL